MARTSQLFQSRRQLARFRVNFFVQSNNPRPAGYDVAYGNLPLLFPEFFILWTGPEDPMSIPGWEARYRRAATVGCWMSPAPVFSYSSYSMIVKWLFSSAKWDFCFVSCPHLSLSVCRVLRVASTYLGTKILLSSWHWLLIIGWELSFSWNIWKKYLFVFVLTSPIMFTLKVFLFKTQ